MSEIKFVKGKAIPKPADDQNTDDIMPARYLKEITFSKMGEYVYRDERLKDRQEVKSHPFNDKRFSGAKILIAGSNYGCGSSREHAPQGLHRYGIQGIIAESFSEIFAGNCASLGVVGIIVPKEQIKNLSDFVEQNPQSEIEIDLESKKIKYGDKELDFEILEGRRQAFLNGTWDAMNLLQQNAQGIQRVEENLEYLKF